MEAILASYKWRARLDQAWFFLCLAAGVAGLQLFTDFNVVDYRWWFYLVKVVVRESGLNRLAWPYSGFLLGGPLVYVAGVAAVRLFVRVKVYGYARKATKRDIRKMGLMDKAGMVVGQAHGVMLMTPKAQHAMISAGTEGGKTQGFSIPTAFHYPGSMVVIDPEGELWEKTSGRRAEFSDCYRLEFVRGEGETARYNPLSLVTLPDDAAGIERRLAQLSRIITPEAKDYWDKGGIKFGNTLCLLEVFDARHEGRDSLITNVAHWTGRMDGIPKSAKDPIKAKLRAAIDRAETRGYPESIVTALRDLERLEPKQREGIIDSFNVEMEAFRSGAVKYALSGCDFSWRTLVEGDRPATLYVVFAGEDRQFVSTMLTVLISNLIFSLTSRPEDVAQKQWPVLFLIEEFSALRRTEALKEVFDRGRKRRIHIAIVAQNLSQIEEKYSQEELRTWMNSTQFFIAFASNDRSLQERFSHMVGQTTRRRESHSGGTRADSVSEGFEGRALVLPQEWGEIPFGEHRLLVKGHLTRPVFCRTPLAYQNKQMKKWMDIPPPPVVPAKGESNEG